MASLESIDAWADRADVVILGSGVAGCVSAIEAYDADPTSDVLIVEKMPKRYEGGNSRASGQQLFCPSPSDIEDLKEYQRALNQPNPVPEDLLDAWAQGMVALDEWLDTMATEVGMRFVREQALSPEFPQYPGARCVNSNNTIHPAPSGVWKAFRAHVDRRSIRLIHETRAIDLIQDPDTLEVFGVITVQNGERAAIQARRAVIVCTGGFENNLEMHRNYWGLDRVYTLGTPANTGDGIRMLEKAGAEIWHMRNRGQTTGLFPAIKVQEFESAFFRNSLMKASSWIEIAKDDRRFYDERSKWYMLHCKHEVHGHWVDLPHAFVMPVHLIFDETTRQSDRIVLTSNVPPKGLDDKMSWNAVVEGYEWSADNSVEVGKGWIECADSLHELALRLGRDPVAVAATVRRFNESCRAGRDEEFGRSPEGMSPIEAPPFYAIEIVPAVVSTTGGGKRNAESQVLDGEGRPIPRLYEAGQLGSTYGNLYQNGSSLPECIVFGRLAGPNAAREHPWCAREGQEPGEPSARWSNSATRM